MFQPHPRDMVQKVVQANREHQNALKVYAERIEAELEGVSKLLAAAEVSENEDELDINAGGTVVIPESVKATGPVSSNDLLAEGRSLFFKEAMKRERYMESIVVHQWKPAELDILRDSVRSENRRIYAVQAQMRCMFLLKLTLWNDPTNGNRGQQTFSFVDAQSPEFFEQNTTNIDWDRVAMKVSSSNTSCVQRSAKECEIRWLGEHHPQFNRTQWTQSEIDRLRDLLGNVVEGQIDWSDIAAKLGTGRTPVDCMRHGIIRRTHSWTPEADERLMQAVYIYGTDTWSLVARYVSEDATPQQCQNRYTRTLDPDIKRGPWTTGEDDMLRRAVAVLGHSWLDVASFIPGRSNEQCRDRYQEYASPTVAKGRWTEEEDHALLKVVDQAGDVSWKEISKLLGSGRTDNMCRNRYATLMKKKQQTPAAADPSNLYAHVEHSEPPRNTDTSDLAIASVSLQNSESPATMLPSDPTSERAEPTPGSRPRPRPKPRTRLKNVGDDHQVIGEYGMTSDAVTNTSTENMTTSAALPVEAATDSGQFAVAPAKRPRGRPRQAKKRSLLDDKADKPPPKRRRRASHSIGSAPDTPSMSQESATSRRPRARKQKQPQDPVNMDAGEDLAISQTAGRSENLSPALNETAQEVIISGTNESAVKARGTDGASVLEQHPRTPPSPATLATASIEPMRTTTRNVGQTSSAGSRTRGRTTSKVTPNKQSLENPSDVKDLGDLSSELSSPPPSP
ncbi:uncharacterized protein FIBRA_04918 [Fibroporia radiculosa]|uniref:snRNA-activating protein complex subunit 4 n=1 Tax=Fibroporia radiculosa TaxID=599839 RepID=J4HWT2_9APHY|nr:uncharacterized protein FIBRA_04918 [Fibroporia radiculosa]CCM02807.1 predicted protein [Fibroporia radiculosa]